MQSHIMIVFFDVERAEYHGQWMDSHDTLMSPERYTKMYEGKFPSETRNAIATPDNIFGAAQNDFHPESWRGALTGWGLLDGCRSMCAGDLVWIDGTWFHCKMSGWDILLNDDAARFDVAFPRDGKFQANSEKQIEQAIQDYNKRS